MTSQIAQTSRGPIEYTLIGNGPVVLACHGTSENCYSTQALESLTDAGFSLLTPSRPGYGRTPLDVGRSNTQAAEALIALLDCLKIQTCSVIAISGGGPTGIALAANFPQRIQRLVLMAALSRPEDRPNEPSYKNQMAFYGPFHGIQWGMLRMISNLSPRGMARQTLAIFSTHDPEDALSKLSPEGIESIRRFYQGQSSRLGALNDATHSVGKELLQAISVPVLVVHSREDKSVPFSHAEWSLQHIPHAMLCEAGCTGHFIWVGPDYKHITEQMAAFLRIDSADQNNSKSSQKCHSERSEESLPLKVRDSSVATNAPSE
jgi:pimeloyl-ACP methyl ester carboxylesterase